MGGKFHSIFQTMSYQTSQAWEMAKQILAALEFDSLVNLLEDHDVSSSVKDVVLFILFMTSEDSIMKHEIRKSVAVPVDSFTSYEDISLYSNTLITSGVDETVRAMIFIVGNTMWERRQP